MVRAAVEGPEGPVRHSMYCFATDVLDEGAPAVLAHLQDRLGVQGVTVATKYHSVADVYPHNPHRRVAVLPPGAYYRTATAGDAGAPVRTVPSPLAAGRDVLAEVCAEAAERGMEVSAWLAVLHHDEVAQGSAGVQENCLGDELAGTLCPSHPEVRQFARALVSEVAGYPLAGVRLESAHFHGAAHGHHHERLLEEYGPGGHLLLGLCFCQWCLSRAQEAGVDAARVAAAARAALDDLLSGRTDGLTVDDVAELAGGAMAAYFGARAATVTSLVAELVEVGARGGADVSFLDQAIASQAYATGRRAGDPRLPDLQFGTDLPALARTGATVEVTGYLQGAAELGEVLAAHAGAGAGGGRRAVVLRPGGPDCAGARELRDKVSVAVAAGVSEVNFYAYGLYRWPTLDRVREALG